MPIESVKIKISKIGLRHAPTRPKWRLEPKFHEAGTFGAWEKTWTDRHTHTHTRFMFYKYRNRGLHTGSVQYIHWTIYTYKMNLLGLSVCLSMFFSATKSPSFMKFWLKASFGTWRSPIFEILIFTDSMGIFCVF